MATHLSLDPELVERALAVSGERTRKAAVTQALEEFVARRRQKGLLDLMGQLDWDASYGLRGRALPQVTLLVACMRRRTAS